MPATLTIPAAATSTITGAEPPTFADGMTRAAATDSAVAAAETAGGAASDAEDEVLR